jgi:uncharacterized lipoprotein YmbA
MSGKALRAGIFAGLLPASLLACATDRTPVREYVLTSRATPASSTTAGGRAHELAVGPVVVPPYLRRSEIVSRVGDNELRASDADRWGEDLGQGLARVVAENLALLVPNLRVSAFPSHALSSDHYRVSIEVARFEQMPDGSVALDARWELVRGKDASPLAVRSATFSEQSSGSDPAAIVEAMSRAVARLSHEIALTLPADDGSVATD